MCCGLFFLQYSILLIKNFTFELVEICRRRNYNLNEPTFTHCPAILTNLLVNCLRTSLYCYPIVIKRLYYYTFGQLLLLHGFYSSKCSLFKFFSLIVVLAQILVSMRTPDAQPINLTSDNIQFKHTITIA